MKSSKTHNHKNNCAICDIKIAILTCSDKGSRGLRQDTAGPAVADVVNKFFSNKKNYDGKIKVLVTDYLILPDERNQIARTLKKWCDKTPRRDAPDVIFTVGGTGLAARDVAPEATRDVMDKLAPGIPEYIRWNSFNKNIHSALSRATAGIRKNTLIINLPGSLKGASETAVIVAPLLAHAVEILRGYTEHN